MHAVDLIRKKRDGKRLSRQELEFLITGYVQGDIPDYQMAAWSMAVYFQGMEPEEITDLTLIMAQSGDTLDLSGVHGVKIDKHSTGGVGDTTTLVVAPLVASCGIPVAKMSGRGLGHTGGTIDKLESIPGFQVSLEPEEFIAQVNAIGLCLVGQTGQLAPADKLLYALRDVTGTVESIPLIASSIMSKKIAAGADGFVLDVKVGTGAFMKTEEDALELAKTMVKIGQLAGRTTVALVTDMNQPLGRAVGNALEVKEAILTLQGRGPERLTELCLELAVEMLLMAGGSWSQSEARRSVEANLQSGAALQKLRELIEAQGGEGRVVDSPHLLPQAKFTKEILAPQSGYVETLDPMEIGMAAMNLGAGRESKDTIIDLAVGIELQTEIGEQVMEKQVLAKLYANDEHKLEQAAEQTLRAFTFSSAKPTVQPTIYRKITAQEL